MFINAESKTQNSFENEHSHIITDNSCEKRSVGRTPSRKLIVTTSRRSSLERINNFNPALNILNKEKPILTEYILESKDYSRVKSISNNEEDLRSKTNSMYPNCQSCERLSEVKLYFSNKLKKEIEKSNEFNQKILELDNLLKKRDDKIIILERKIKDYFEKNECFQNFMNNKIRYIEIKLNLIEESADSNEKINKKLKNLENNIFEMYISYKKFEDNNDKNTIDLNSLTRCIKKIPEFTNIINIKEEKYENLIEQSKLLSQEILLLKEENEELKEKFNTYTEAFDCQIEQFKELIRKLNKENKELKGPLALDRLKVFLHEKELPLMVLIDANGRLMDYYTNISICDKNNNPIILSNEELFTAVHEKLIDAFES